MSWLNLNQSLNSLKGQITNFASEVLSEGVVQDSSESSSRTDVSFKDLEEKCRSQEQEIAALKKLNSELEATLQSERYSKKNGVKDEETTWYWDPPSQPSHSDQQELVNKLQKQISDLTAQLNENKIVSQADDEPKKLKEENKQLTLNLLDLDNQHQQAMERLLTLKKELQKNFEILKQEHADLKSANEEYLNEKQTLLNTIAERDKELAHIKAKNTDYDTIHHKYVTLEKIHGLLQENVEKFQEENQDLNEEIFKLQEQVTKYEHELELVSKHSELSNMVPRENYEALLKELNEIKQRYVDREQPEETNIDDNAKSVIEGLKREIKDLKHKLSQKELFASENEAIPSENIMKLYNKYINFELPVDYIGEMPSSGDSVVLFKLESVFKTLNSFKRDKDALEHQISEKNHTINHMQTQIDDLTSENDFLSSDVQHFDRELNEMKKNNDFLLHELTALKNTSKLEPIIETFETHDENVVKLETELDKCNKKNKTFESEIKRIEKELADVKAEKVELQESLNDLKNKYTVMLKDLEAVNSESQAVQELEKSVKSKDLENHKTALDEIDELKKKFNAAVAKNEELSIDIHIIENDKVLLTKEIDDLNNYVSECTSSKKILEDINDKLEDKIKIIQNKYDELINSRKQLENEKEKLMQDFDEQMQRNNLLQSEIDKTTLEKSQIAANLEHTLNKNATIEDTVQKLSAKVSHLENELKDVNILQQNSSEHQTEDTKILQDLIQNMQEKLAHQKIFENEIQALKEDKQELIERKLQLEAHLTDTDVKLTNLEGEYEKVNAELNEKKSLLHKQTATLEEYSDTISKLNETIANLNKTIDIKNKEIYNLSETTAKVDSSFEELKKLQHEKNDYHRQILNLNEEVENKNSEVSKLSTLVDELKANIDTKDKQIKELNQSIVELTDKMKSFENFSQINDEYLHLLREKETIEKEAMELKNTLFNKEMELSEAKHEKAQETENLHKALEEYKNITAAMNQEKQDLINLINLKHNESIQYHNEIQRLNQVILEQTNEYKNIIDQKDALLQMKSDSCGDCENLRITLKEKDEIIVSLNKNGTDYERLSKELQQANDSIISLKERCENLDKSVAIQLENVKRLTAENIQLSEKEQSSTKELDRLRLHLVEMEENYTQELMTSEQKLAECQTRLYQVEERAKQTSNVYTSNSIRANQEVETLRNQIKLLEKQRDDVQAKLSDAEDARSRSEAALTNLQVVLEQFQLDKEREIHVATEKIRNKLEDEKRQNQSLRDEMKRLNAKLEEALAGLQAASRLGDQLETKTAQINDLKEQVRTLQISVGEAEQRYFKATSNQQDKVDKNLVKNLVINYVQTAAQNSSNSSNCSASLSGPVLPASSGFPQPSPDRRSTSIIQVLRILSTVLDFNQKECEKLGLARSSNPPDSLAAEFVKFLQNESKPRAALPNMMGIAQSSSRSSTPSSRKNSTMGPNPIIEPGHTRTPSTGSNNLLFQNLDVLHNLETSSQISIESETIPVRGTLDTGVTQTRDTEGAILKHVLRDM